MKNNQIKKVEKIEPLYKSREEYLHKEEKTEQLTKPKKTKKNARYKENNNC